jgi:UDPglucose 6-dehydrogenase
LIFIAVGTPPDEDGSADLKYVLQVADTIALHMQSKKVVINKSTVPVGTADKVKAAIQSRLVKRKQLIEFSVVSNPEFLKEGAAVADCTRPDRIIIGTDNAEAEKLMRELYAPYNRNHQKIIVMDIRSAELTKYAANCMLATKISFMNEMSNLAEKLGADIEAVRHGIGSDQRIGYQFIYAGCGYGGSCFPKDIQALIRTANDHGHKPAILEAVESTNVAQKDKLFKYITSHFNNDLTGKTIALWGLSFKPNTDDMREASSRRFMELAWEAGAQIQAFDPEAMNEAQRIYGHRDDLQLVGTKEAALRNADALVICTEWTQFRAPDFELIKQLINNPVIIDGRNLYDPALVEEKGIAYYGIGRGRSVSAG